MIWRLMNLKEFMLIVGELPELVVEVFIKLVEGCIVVKGAKLHIQLTKMVWYGVFYEAVLLSVKFTYTALRAEI